MTRAADLSLRVVSASPAGAEIAVRLDPEFAGFAGHFPGEPVLPGMCHVDLALRAAAAVLGAELDLVAVHRARFLRKSLPADELRIRLAFGPPGGEVTSIAADHSVDGEPVAELRLDVSRRAAPPARP